MCVCSCVRVWEDRDLTDPVPLKALDGSMAVTACFIVDDTELVNVRSSL